ncbi:PilN domain-containing protein [Arenimonas aestuarii]
MPAVDTLITSLETLRLRLARTPLPGWGHEAAAAWRDLLPAGLRPLLQGEANRLLLDRHSDLLQVAVADAAGERPLGDVSLDDPSLQDALARRLGESPAPVWLMLPASAVLRRTLTLPAAAEARLRDVLAHEIDRQTPFSADQVSFEGRVLARDAAGQSLRVELLVLPRARLERELQSIGPLAGCLAGADVRDADGRGLGVNLLTHTQRARRSDPSRRFNLGLAAVALVALLLALGLVRYNRGEALADLRADVADATAEVRQARLARNQLVAKVEAANFLATRRAAQPTMLELLDELTRLIPDDTSVDKLTVNDGRLVMVGQSRAAPALVGLLQASPLLEEPALTGAVQADPRTGRDRFTLTARVVGANPEAGDDTVR